MSLPKKLLYCLQAQPCTWAGLLVFNMQRKSAGSSMVAVGKRRLYTSESVLLHDASLAASHITALASGSCM